MAGGNRIKGGGRAFMSQDSQQALIDLLMRLSRDVDANSDKNLSEHEQKRERRRFTKKLVQEHERNQLRKKYAANQRAGSNNDAQKIFSRAAASGASTGPIKSLSTNKNTIEKVRIELVEAIFKDDNSNEKRHSKKDKKEKKPKKDKKKSSSSDSLKFKEGTKKVMVLSRSTCTKDLLKLASSKLKIKKPLRLFLKVSKTTHWNLGDDDDLFGVEDGTALYVTTTPDRSNTNDDTEENNETEMDNENSDENTGPEIDPLDVVKRAYEKQEENRLKRRQNPSNNKSECSSTMIIDQEKKEKYSTLRAELPAAAFKHKILESVKENKVIVLCGATGCGKSTQVPQFLLEHEESIEQNINIPKNAQKYIVVTQPRRVAAIALANRVAEERGSPPPGQAGSSVGYMVRSDRKVNDGSCRIIYMTVGILLRMLVSQSQSIEERPPSSFSIHNISHLVIDEVHERDVNTDFTLTLLRGMLLSSSSLSNMRVILMSATAASDLFVKYFTPKGPAAKPPVVLEIPGRTFPVDIKWLPDCQAFAGTSIWRPGNQHNVEQQIKTPETGPQLSPRAREKIDDKFVRALIVNIVRQQQADGLLQENCGRSNTRSTGAILVFLPGRGEIESMAACLSEKSTIVGDRDLCNILKLHSTVPKNEQQKVFRPALEGTVKIVLATNIAETSVTISDVSDVIDTCRVKESRYNPSSRTRELITVWTSRASMKQRAGRAGRTSAGVCWRLCSEEFCQKELLPQTAPEMLRTPLDELVLQICLLYEQRRDDFYKSDKSSTGAFAAGAQPVKFLSQTPAPPPRNNLLQACRHLLEVDALRVVDTNGREGEEDAWSYRLTPLGYHLSRLPMDAKVGKVLIVGCILGCLDGALTVAAALSCTKSCFLSAFGNPANLPMAFQARESLIENGFGGKDWPGGTIKGDLIAVIAAYRAWKKHKSDGQKWKFCSNHAMDNASLRELDRLRNQFRDLLVDAGFVAISDPRNTKQGATEYNYASEDALLTSCCLVAGLYPNICSLIRPRKGGPKGGRLYTNDGDECRPQSNSFQRKRLQQASETGKDAYAVYHAKHKSIGVVSSAVGQRQRPPEVFLTEVNFVSRFALLLFGGNLEIVENAIIVDGWLKFKVGVDGDKPSSEKGEIVNNAVLILALREKLDGMILEHVLKSSAKNNPGSEGSLEDHRRIIQVVRKLLSDEGK